MNVANAAKTQNNTPMLVEMATNANLVMKAVLKMIIFEYECWKCEQWHQGTTESQEELTAIAQDIGVMVRIVDGEITCNDCGKPAKNENAIIHDNGDKFCYECQ